MNPYFTLGARDASEAARFYDAVLATIGWSSHASFGTWRGYSQGGSGEGVVFWSCTPFDGGVATAGNGAMVGFAARSKAEVDSFYTAALANGGSDEGKPGPREAYGPAWYSAYMRDPTGNKIGVYIKWEDVKAG